jgi:hypothetical protein
MGVDTESNHNELKDKQGNSDLVETIKQTFMEEYKQTYHQLPCLVNRISCH